MHEKITIQKYYIYIFSATDNLSSHFVKSTPTKGGIRTAFFFRLSSHFVKSTPVSFSLLNSCGIFPVSCLILPHSHWREICISSARRLTLLSLCFCKDKVQIIRICTGSPIFALLAPYDFCPRFNTLYGNEIINIFFRLRRRNFIQIEKHNIFTASYFCRYFVYAVLMYK